MEKNLGIVGRIFRIVLGMALLWAAFKLARKEGRLAKRGALGLALAGFFALAQGWHGVCLLRTLGVKTPV